MNKCVALLFILLYFSILKSYGQVPPVCFPTPYTFNLSDAKHQLIDPVGPVVADFNKDGIPDVAVANGSRYDSSIAIMFGNGDGTLKSALIFQGTEDYASAIVANDFNRDGKQDLAVCYPNNNHVIVYLGDGKGNFTMDTVYTVGKNPVSIISRDMDRDGYPDIVTLNTTAGNCTILYGNAKGKMPTSATISIGFFPRIFTSDYMVGDTMPDLVVAGYTASSANGQVQIWYPSAASPRTYKTGSVANTLYVPYGITTGDFNGDTKLDVVITAESAYGTMLLSGTNSGTLGKTKMIDNYAYSIKLASADMNGDGNLDIIGGNRVLFNRNDGTFQDSLFYSLVPSNFALGDFNKDSKPDIVALADGVQLALNKGNGVFSAGHFESHTSGQKKYVVVDLDKNGYADMVATNTSNNTLIVEYRGPYPSGYKESVFSLSAQPQGQGLAYPVKLDTLGNTDLVVSTFNGTEFWFNTGTSFTRMTVSSALIGNQVGNVVCDINGDKLKDFVTYGGNSVVLFTASKSSPYFKASTYTAGNTIRDITTADYNGDGLADVAVCNYYSDNVTVFYGQKSGGFTSGTTYSCCKRPGFIRSGDINGDKIPDLIVASADNAEISVLLGNSSATFGSATSYSLYGRPASLYIEDFDNDGYNDVCVTNTGLHARYISVLKGASSGTLSTVANYHVQTSPYNVVTADYNNDGITDIAFGTGNGNQVELSLGLGKGVFDTNTIVINTLDQSYYMYAADMNNDNKLDLVYSGSQYTSWYLNESSIIGNKNDTFCGVAPLDAGEASTYKWSNGDTGRVSYVTKSGDYYVNTSTIYGCGNKSVVRHVVIIPNPHFPVISASNDTMYCTGDSTILRIKKYPKETYLWYRNDSLQKTATDTFFKVKKAAKITVVAVNYNGCKLGNTVRVSSSTPVTAKLTTSNNTTFCQGDSAKLSATLYTKDVKYRWYLDGKLLPDTTTSIMAKKPGSYTASLLHFKCPSLSNAIKITVNAIPKVSLTTVGAATACKPDSVNLIAATDSGALLSWYRNTVNVLANTNRKTLGATSTADYYVKASKNGCTASSTTLHTTVNPSPKASVSVAGPLSLCKGQKLSLTQLSDTGISYAWYKNGVFYNNNNAIQVTDSGIYKMVVSTKYGCKDSSAGYKVSVTDVPVSKISALGNTTFCEGDSVKIKSTTYNKKYNYSWLRNVAKLSGTNDTIITAKQSGYYQLVVKNGSTCADTSVAIGITVNALPQAQITQNGKVLNALTGSGYSYQWYRNDTLINGAVSSSYSPALKATYYVKVTGTGGCTEVSNKINFNTQSIEDTRATAIQNLMVFPNPGDGNFTLKYSSPYTGNVRLVANDLLGRQVMTISFHKSSNNIEMPLSLKGQPKGSYMLSIIEGNESKTVHIIIF